MPNPDKPELTIEYEYLWMSLRLVIFMIIFLKLIRRRRALNI